MITLGYGSRCWKGTTIQTTSMAITSMAIIDPIIILQPKARNLSGQLAFCMSL